MSADPRTGKVLQGRYKILAPLAEGGMGIVYRGERVGIGRPVVIKFLHTMLSDQPGIVDRFEREARATALLNHPNCVALVDYGIENGQPYLVMEYAEGKTLADLLDFGALAPRRAVHIARQILAGLSHAHERGILHRDLKPANIMVCEAIGHTDFVKILDFGLAKLLGQVDGKRDVTVQGIAIGTPGYMSPEQASGVPSDRRADIYCTGALLYHLVTGAKAFDGDDIHSVLRRHREETPMLPRAVKGSSSISNELEAVVTRSMQRDPGKRYQTAEEMIDALRGTPEARRRDDISPTGERKSRPGSGSNDATRAESAGSRRARKSRSRSTGLLVGVGILLGAGATVAVALYTPLFSNAKPSDRKDPPSIAVAPPHATTPHLPVPPLKPVEVPAPPKTVELALPQKPIELPPSPSPSPSSDPPPQVKPTQGTPPAVATNNVKPPDADPGLDDDDEDGPRAKADDGSNEDDRATPPPVPAAPRREMPQVRSVADVRVLLRKGDPDGALAGLYRLRQQKPAPTGVRGAEIASLIGHLYFDRRWWTDALREYRFACRQSPRAKSDSILVNNTVRTLGDRGTYYRARRLLLDYIGRSAIPSLRTAARSGASADLRSHAQKTLDKLEGKRTASRRVSR